MAKPKYKPNPDPHPLEDIAMRAFAKEPRQDATTLSSFMSGCTVFGGKDGSKGMSAYKTVADDVLGYMREQGKLVIEQSGWYGLARAEKAGACCV